MCVFVDLPLEGKPNTQQYLYIDLKSRLKNICLYLKLQGHAEQSTLVSLEIGIMNNLIYSFNTTFIDNPE